VDKNFEVKSVREGAIIKGRVIRKQDGDVFVDIDYKAEGVIPKEETVKYNYYEALAEGAEIDVYVKRSDGQEGMVTLSKIIADKKVIFSKVKKAHKDGAAIDGEVIKAVKGGFIIDFGANVTAFLPMSHSKAYGEDITGKKLPFKIIQLDEEKRNVVVSYKEYIDEISKKEEENIKKNFTVNQKTQVRVATVKDAGIDVEKGGIITFIPDHELSWKPMQDIKKEFTEGSMIEVLVAGLDKNRVSLSVKRLTENPFEKFMSSRKQGDRVKVTVKEIRSDGITAGVEGEVEGFIPAGEISYFRRVKNAAEIYKPGDEIEACVIKMDGAGSKAILSVKRLENNPWQTIEERYPVGARVAGVISQVTEGDGAEVELEENFDAYMHISNISWFSFASIADVLKPGEKKEFKILGIDKNKYRIMLGLKQLLTSPWSSFTGKYREGGAMDVKITDIEDSAIVCQIMDGVSGRIMIKNRSKLAVKKGDVINVRIAKIDKDAKKVLLTGKDLEITEAKKQIDEYMKTHEHSFKMDDVANFGNVNKDEQK
jgi:small subunit ribosomal protein S1